MAVSRKQERDWQAESDAHVMATYQEILQDKSRLSRAIKEAKKQASNLNRRAAVMSTASNVKASGGRVVRKR